MEKRLIFRWIGALCLSALVAGCQTSRLDPATTLRVGVTANFPPFIDKSGSRYTGLEAEFAKRLAAELGKDVHFADMKWESLLPALNDGKIDIIMSGMTVTEPRQLLASFSPGYMVSGQVMMIRLDDARRYRHPSILSVVEAKVGVEAGTVGDLVVQRNCRKAKRETFRSLKLATDALVAGKIDLVVGDAPVLLLMAASREADGIAVVPVRMTNETIAWAVDKNNPELIDQVNAVHAKWRENGDLQKALQRWIPGLQSVTHSSEKAAE